jgi:dephospho-CoA kinase
MERSIILIAGKAGSGKDTVANHLVKNHSFKRFAFADTLKEYTSKKYNVPLELLFSQEGKKEEIDVDNKKITIRNLLIKEGKEKREQDINYWVDLIIKKIEAEPVTQDIIISDFRFPNEYNRMQEFFSELSAVLVVRENGSEKIDDESETALNLFQFDRVIFNDRTIYDLEKIVDNDLSLIKQICKKRKLESN